MKKTLNVAMMGGGFMGRAHSNAWQRVNTFFDAPYNVNLKVIVGSHTPLEAFAEKWGYDEVSYDWQEVVKRDDIDIVDIGTPTYMHKDMAIEAAKNGKHIVVEKPCAASYSDCMEMYETAKKAGVVNYLNHNYRRVPAVALAKKLIDEGRIGRVFHWRGAYLQDWIIDPEFPLTWNLRADRACGGALFDLGSHAVDLARFLIGEPNSVSARLQTFIKKRPLPGANAATFSKGESTGNSEYGDVTVDDGAFMILDFDNGALGSIDVTRFACGRKNYNDFEVYGDKGAIMFNFERMNELEFLDYTQPGCEQGYKRILVTESDHPYVSAWWPAGHLIGYEHTFVNAFSDFLSAIYNKTEMSPDFLDGANTIRVLEAARLSSDQKRSVRISEIV